MNGSEDDGPQSQRSPPTPAETGRWRMTVDVDPTIVAKEQRTYRDMKIRREWQKEYLSFSGRVRELDLEFDKFMRVFRPLGSSSRIIRAAKDLQVRLKDVLELLKSNSAEIWKEFSGTMGNDELPNDLEVLPDSKYRSAIDFLPCALYALSEGLKAIMEGLYDIPEFLDKRLTDSLQDFREWSLFRARCIMTNREGLGKQWAPGTASLNLIPGSIPLRRSTICLYIGQVMKEMPSHTLEAKDALSSFIQDGVPAIQKSQGKSQARLSNMSTVATFLSAVTATTLQYDIGSARESGYVQITAESVAE
ncbi:hypothetical protein FS837_001201 [Tulasnella sp. UAMH 9824]|nr:hypothetical protein FS837_001201 [Tulasnella sp. UAMH 9824]